MTQIREKYLSCQWNQLFLSLDNAPAAKSESQNHSHQHYYSCHHSHEYEVFICFMNSELDISKKSLEEQLVYLYITHASHAIHAI